VVAVLRPCSIARCRGSPTQAHCSSTVAAWCGTDEASASVQPIESPAADQYQESGVATSWRCASVLPTAVLSWLVCARTAARRVVRSKVPLAGARRLRSFSLAIQRDGGVRRLAPQHREWPSSDTTP